MNILVIGSGGREHSIAWKIGQSPNTTNVFMAGNNSGVALEEKCQAVDISVDPYDIIKFSDEQGVDLVVIGPEAPLTEGLADALEQAGIRCVGPKKEPAQLESSKAFAKHFLKENNIPTAAFEVFKDFKSASQYLETLKQPPVIKMDGLAAGKGVVVAKDMFEAREAVRSMLEKGDSIVIEERLTGREISFIVAVDGEDFIPLMPAKDHKRLLDNDQGPNTGGMGAYCPAVANEALYEQIIDTIIKPTVSGMSKQGWHYKGFLYAGLMIHDDGTINVLEFNCRLGDPEAQILLKHMRSDFLELCLGIANGSLDQVTVDWLPGATVGVVIAEENYPLTPKIGKILPPDNTPDDIKVFHAGTKHNGTSLVTNGGRVLCVTTTKPTLEEARTHIYTHIPALLWEGAQYRTDIGKSGK